MSKCIWPIRVSVGLSLSHIALSLIVSSVVEMSSAVVGRSPATEQYHQIVPIGVSKVMMCRTVAALFAALSHWIPATSMNVVCVEVY